MKAGLVGDVRPLVTDMLCGGEAALAWEFWSRKGLRDVGLSGAVLGILKVVVCGEGKL